MVDSELGHPEDLSVFLVASAGKIESPGKRFPSTVMLAEGISKAEDGGLERRCTLHLTRIAWGQLISNKTGVRGSTRRVKSGSSEARTATFRVHADGHSHHGVCELYLQTGD